MRAVAFTASSGTGKTTLLEKLIPELTGRGWRIGALKHKKNDFAIDHPGKDSHRLAQAGAEVTVIASDDKLALVERPRAPRAVEQILARFFPEVDLVLVEGFGESPLPRIELRRKGVPPRDARGGIDPRTIAIASDLPPDLPGDLPVLDLGDVRAIADFIEKRFLKGAR